MAAPDKIRNTKDLGVISEIVPAESTTATISHEKASTTMVRRAVARSEFVFLMPHLARIEVILRRVKRTENVYTYGDILVNVEEHTCKCAGKEIYLTPKEFEVLELLMSNPGKVYSRENLLKAVWGVDYPGDVRTVDVHVRRLREKIENSPSEPKFVQTKWGVGYYFKE